MKPLNTEVSSDRYPRFHTTGLSPAEADYSRTNTIGMEKLLLNLMVQAKLAGTWFWLCGRERALFSLALRLDLKLHGYYLLRVRVSVLKSLRETCGRGYATPIKAMRTIWASQKPLSGQGTGAPANVGTTGCTSDSSRGR
jgi:hypothetical protein